MGRKNTRGSDSIHVLGIDPGLATMGVAVLRLEKDREEICKLAVLTTAPSAKRVRAYASDDNARRAGEVFSELQRIGWDYRLVAIAAESMSFPRNSSSAAKIALSWGVIVALAQQWDVPLLQVDPMEIKLDVAGKKTASKADVALALSSIYDQPFDELLVDVPASQHEHAYDALAAAVTCLQSDGIRMLRAALS